MTHEMPETPVEVDINQCNALLRWFQLPYTLEQPELPGISERRIKKLGLESAEDLLVLLAELDEPSQRAAMVYCAGFPAEKIREHEDLMNALYELMRRRNEQGKASVSVEPAIPNAADTIPNAHWVRRSEAPRRASVATLAAKVVNDDDDALAWRERALCVQIDPEIFFPEKGGSTRAAKKVCLSCDARSKCLEYALANDERFGIWGGLSERERRKLKNRAV